MIKNETERNGYDLEVTGLYNGQFLRIHVPALVCIFLSLFSVVAVLICSFKKKSIWKFFNWSKSERFVVYIAICDGMFNICHSMDHLHIIITRNHVYPPPLCRFYGFMLAEFITAQNLLVNFVSINAYVLIFYRKKINFGIHDYRLLLYIFGTPFVSGLIAWKLKVLGPNGSFCYFDGVKGEIANLLMTTVPLCLILVVNITLYILTWHRIKTEEPKFKDISGKTAKIVRASHMAAKTMSLFVAAFIVQWWAMAAFGVVQVSLDKEVPQELFQFVTTFSNIGGILNGIVYIIIRKRHKNRASKEIMSSENSMKLKRIQLTDSPNHNMKDNKENEPEKQTVTTV